MQAVYANATADAEGAAPAAPPPPASLDAANDPARATPAPTLDQPPAAVQPTQTSGPAVLSPDPAVPQTTAIISERSAQLNCSTVVVSTLLGLLSRSDCRLPINTMYRMFSGYAVEPSGLESVCSSPCITQSVLPLLEYAHNAGCLESFPPTDLGPLSYHGVRTVGFQACSRNQKGDRCYAEFPEILSTAAAAFAAGSRSTGLSGPAGAAPPPGPAPAAPAADPCAALEQHGCCVGSLLAVALTTNSLENMRIVADLGGLASRCPASTQRALQACTVVN
jgi:hypothetical protein